MRLLSRVWQLLHGPAAGLLAICLLFAAWFAVDPGSGGLVGASHGYGHPTPTPTSTPTPGPAPTATLAVSSLEVSPSIVDPGEPVQLSFVLQNTSFVDAINAPIIISVDGAEDHRIFVTREADSATIISTSVTSSLAGVHQVAVGPESDPAAAIGTFTVRQLATVEPTPPPPTPTPVIVSPDTSGPSADNAVTVSVRLPIAAPVRFEKRTATTLPPPAGFRLLDHEILIETALATPEAPISVTFELHETIVPASGTITVFRNGAVVPACTAASGVASPDPCVASSTLLENGNLRVVVLTSEASLWNFGVAEQAATPTPTPSSTPTPRPSPSPTQQAPPTASPTPTTAPTTSPTPSVTPTSRPSATPTPTVVPVAEEGGGFPFATVLIVLGVLLGGGALVAWAVYYWRNLQ